MSRKTLHPALSPDYFAAEREDDASALVRQCSALCRPTPGQALRRMGAVSRNGAPGQGRGRSYRNMPDHVLREWSIRIDDASEMYQLVAQAHPITGTIKLLANYVHARDMFAPTPHGLLSVNGGQRRTPRQNYGGDRPCAARSWRNGKLRTADPDCSSLEGIVR